MDSPNHLLSLIKREFSQAVLADRPFGRTRQSSLWIEAKKLAEIARFLCQNDETRFEWLENMVAMEIDGSIVISYFLRNHEDYTLIVRLSVVPKNPEEVIELASVNKIWPMAAPFEGEISELFGIHFLGSVATALGPLLPKDWVGFPLRKNYLFPSEFMEIPHSRPVGRTIRDDTGEVSDG